MLESRQIFDVICHDNEWLKVYYGETAEIGKWWTRPFGWIHAQTDSDDSAEFIHLRGLVPTTEGKQKECASLISHVGDHFVYLVYSGN